MCAMTVLSPVNLSNDAKNSFPDVTNLVQHSRYSPNSPRDIVPGKDLRGEDKSSDTVAAPAHLARRYHLQRLKGCDSSPPRPRGSPQQTTSTTRGNFKASSRTSPPPRRARPLRHRLHPPALETQSIRAARVPRLVRRCFRRARRHHESDFDERGGDDP